jgi:hypothetical protein
MHDNAGWSERVPPGHSARAIKHFVHSLAIDRGHPFPRENAMLVARLYLSDDRRAADRVAVGAETTMRVDGTPLSAEVEDISETGCLIRLTAGVALSVGDKVRIGLPGTGAFDAEIVRVAGNATGCRFVRPLSADQLAAAFASDVVVAGEWSPEQTPADRPDPDKLSVRTRLAIIVGLSVGLWVAIGTVVYALLR